MRHGGKILMATTTRPSEIGATLFEQSIVVIVNFRLNFFRMGRKVERASVNAIEETEKRETRKATTTHRWQKQRHVFNGMTS